MARKLIPLAFVALLIWWLWPGNDTDHDGLLEVAPDAPPEPAHLSVLGREGRRSTESPAREKATESTEDAMPEDGPLLEGTVVVAETDGTLHPHEDGEIRVLLVDEDRRTPDPTIRLPVQRGAFRTHLGCAVRLVIERVVLGGRPAALRGVGERGEVSFEDARSLSAVWKARTLLHVLDAETDHPLEDVQVTWGAQAEDVLGIGWTGESPSLVVRGPSPLEVPGPVPISAVHARDALVVVLAKDHAFKRVPLDIAQGGTREVRLERSGSLRLAVTRTGRLEGHDLLLRLTRPSEADLAEDASSILHGPRFRDAQRTIEVAHLAAGPWQVEILWNYRSLWRKTVEIVAGGTTTLDAQVEVAADAARPPAQEVRLDVEVVLEEGWPPKDVALLLGRIGTRMQRTALEACTRVGATSWRWSLDVVPGRWFVAVEPAGVVQLVMDPDQPDLVPRIRVPAPATVTVQCVWKHDGRATSLERLRWSSAQEIGGSPWHAGGIATKLPDGRFEVRLVPMRIQLHPYRPEGGRTPTELVVDVQPGEREVRFELERYCEVHLELYDGETRVPWFAGIDDRNTALPLFETPHPRFDFDDEDGVLLVHPAGRWRFLIQPGPDYQEPPPIDLDLLAGENSVHRIPLRRK